MKILFFRLGDSTRVLLATPLIRCLHRTVPTAELHVLTEPGCAHLLRNHPYAQKLHLTTEKELLFASLRKEGFDLLIDLQNDAFGRLLEKSLQCETVKAGQRKKPVFVFKRSGRKAVGAGQIVQDYFDALAPFGIDNDGEGLDCFIPDAAQVPAQDIPHSHHAGFICLSLEAAHPTNALPVQTYRDLCSRLAHPVILIGTNTNAELGNAVASVDPVKVYNACGKFSSAEIADLLRQSRMLVTGISPWVQIGAALKKEMLVIQKGQMNENAAPYYGNKLLQRRPELAEIIRVKAPWWQVREAVPDVQTALDRINGRLYKKR